MLLIEVIPNKCDLCGACVGVCPEDAMELTQFALAIDENLCTNCSKCVWVCPLDALFFNKEKLNSNENK